MIMADNKIVANNGCLIGLYSTEDGNRQLEVKLEKNALQTTHLWL